jgi:DNA repair protein RecN (Recombination protein N)
VLKNIRISNFALIRDLELDFTKGFTVITGETGSGKSIFLGALNLLLGERADFSLIGPHTNKSIVEANFSISAKQFSSWFERNDLDFESETIIRREINEQGRSRAFINDVPVTLQVLKELSENLLFIHSQHYTHSLRDKTFHRELLDLLLGLKSEVEEYAAEFSKYKKNILLFKKEKEQLDKALAERDYLQFQVQELETLQLDKTNFSALEDELKIAQNREGIISALQQISTLEEEGQALESLKVLEKDLSRKMGLNSFLDAAMERIRAVIVELDDLGQDAQENIESILNQGAPKDDIAQRMDEFNRILVKHRAKDQEELRSMFNDWSDQLFKSEVGETHLAELEKKINTQEKLLQSKAKNLLDKRKKGAPSIEKRITAGLAELKMEGTKVLFQIDPLKELHSGGIDEIELQFSPTQGLAVQSIAKIASGGELSRLMLCLQQLISEKKKLPTVLLDEIDTGVSGEVALKMGRLMRKMGQSMQLLAITHLPQVAGQGEQHFKVLKSQVDDVTESTILPLKEEERLKEIAGLMSGEDLSDAALQNARALMELK